MENACLIVRDANGQALAYVYFEGESGRRSAAHLLTRDESRRIAADIAKLPEHVAGEGRQALEPASSRRLPRLLDHLVGLYEQRGRYLDPERLGGI